MYVRVDVDPDDILEEIGLEDIVSFIKKHYGTRAVLEELEMAEAVKSANDVESYWHGDMDIKALLKELGAQETKKIIADLVEEGAVHL